MKRDTINIPRKYVGKPVEDSVNKFRIWIGNDQMLVKAIERCRRQLDDGKAEDEDFLRNGIATSAAILAKLGYIVTYQDEPVR